MKKAPGRPKGGGRPQAEKVRQARRRKQNRWLKAGHEVQRQRYGDLSSLETVYHVWFLQNTLKGTWRVLRTLEGFESISENTVRSILHEHREDWLRRKTRDMAAVEDKTRELIAEECGTLEAKARRTFLKGLLDLAETSAMLLPKALRKLADKLDDGELKAQDLMYGLPKMLKELSAAFRPREAQPLVQNVDRRSVHIHRHIPPSETAKRRTKKELEAEVARRLHALDINRV